MLRLNLLKCQDNLVFEAKLFVEEIKTILIGIDYEETNHKDGWWETSKGAKFGRERLSLLLTAFANFVMKINKKEITLSVSDGTSEFIDRHVPRTELLSREQLHSISSSPRATSFLDISSGESGLVIGSRMLGYLYDTLEADDQFLLLSDENQVAAILQAAIDLTKKL
jgi:hypothetical protein